jgi:pimeloyl-ACP methyl ester carboxylesterase
MQFARRLLKIVLITVIAGYLLICGALFAFQRSLIYYPQPNANEDPATLLTFPVGSATVQVSAHPQAGPAALIYFGGNADDVSQDVPALVHAFPDRAIYALHYPGYGGSSGSPSEQAIFADSLALFDRVHADHPNIIVIGRSLGSGVAVWVASQRPLARLVLVTPFDSLADPAAAQYPIFPVRWLLRDKFESWRYAPHVSTPTRIIVAENDETVPRSSSDRLRTRFKEGVASYVVVPRVGHNTIQNAPGYWALVNSE